MFHGSILSTPEPSRDEFTLEFCNGSGARKTRMMPLPECQKSVTISPFVLTQYWYWRTDRHTDNIVLCMHRHAVCDKNERTSSKLYDDVYAQLINAFWSNHGFPLNLANDPSVTFQLKRGTVYPSN